MASAVQVGEFDLGDEARLDPMHALARDPFGQSDGRIRSRERLELSVQLDQLRRY